MLYRPILSPTVELPKNALFQNQITVGAEISEGVLPSWTSILTSYFVQSIVDYHNVIAISREYAAVTSKSLLQLRHIINSMKNETFIQILNREYIQQIKRAKCVSLKSCHSFQFIAISSSAIINESVNTAQLHHLCTLFIIIRGLS